MEKLFSGDWLRNEVELKGDTIFPVPPFVSYDVFSYYHPASEVRQGERSLYLEFLEVDAGKPERVLDFCRRYGVLGSDYELQKTIWRNRKNYEDKPMEGLISPSPEARILNAVRFAGNPNLTLIKPPETKCFPMPLSLFKNNQQWLRQAISPSPEFFGNRNEEEKREEIEIPAINQILHESCVRPRLNWNVQKARWEITWTSLTLTGFLYLMYVLDKLGPGKILSCPHCHKFFLTASNRVRFCSSRCNDVFKVQKFQQKNREKKTAQSKPKKGPVSKPTIRKK